MAAAARAALEALAALPVDVPGRAPKGPTSAGHWYDSYLGFGQDFGEGLYDGFKSQAMFGWNTSVGHLLLDPKGSAQFLQEQGDVGELAGKHPDQFGKSLIDWNDWTAGHPGRASGELLATVATLVAFKRGPSALAATGPESRTLLQLSTAESWGNRSTLSDHLLRHGRDFGAATEHEYAAQASLFLQRSQMTGLPTKIGTSGVIRVYDPATGTFAAYNADGTTRTYFVPRRGQAYFDDQPGLPVHWLGKNP
jgi:hypothetical protein